MALVLREEDVKPFLRMPDILHWVEAATRAYGEGRARNIPRQRVKFRQGWLHVLPAGDLDQQVLGLKAYTSFRDGNRFLVMLYSADNGQLLALIEANALGMMRTGAMSGLATKYLARQDADIYAVFGTGWQARGQVLGVAASRKLKQIRVFGRNAEHREQFAGDMAREVEVEVVPAASAADALDGALIVSTATTAREPLFDDDLVQPGSHINAIGSNSLIRQEIGQRLVRKGNPVVVDSRAQAQQESGDLLIPTELGYLDWDSLPEISDIVTGRVPGRQSDQDITIFESHGLGLQDISVAAHVYQLARAAGIGEVLRLFDA